jgi:hypothetical protein
MTPPSRGDKEADVNNNTSEKGDDVSEHTSRRASAKDVRKFYGKGRRDTFQKLKGEYDVGEWVKVEGRWLEKKWSYRATHRNRPTQPKSRQQRRSWAK